MLDVSDIYQEFWDLLRSSEASELLSVWANVPYPDLPDHIKIKVRTMYDLAYKIFVDSLSA